MYTQPEYPARFGELANSLTSKFGQELVLNLDTLKDQKIDPKIGGILLEIWFRFKNLILFSDYCGYKKDEVDLFYERHKVMGRKDPA